MFEHITAEQVGISSKKVRQFIKVLDGHNLCTHSIKW